MLIFSTILDLLIDPVRINVGAIGQVNSDVTQIPIFLDREEFKMSWLQNELPHLCKAGSVLIFVRYELVSLFNTF